MNKQRTITKQAAKRISLNVRRFIDEQINAEMTLFGEQYNAGIITKRELLQAEIDLIDATH